MDVVAISELRANLPRFIGQASQGLKRFIVTISGKPKAVVMSLDELESLEETAEILSIPRALKKIKDSQKQIRQGKRLSLEELEKKL